MLSLLQISIGQEETDDIISRDINRTFPEHPQFAFEQGQNALFRVLKAYSLHDLEARALATPQCRDAAHQICPCVLPICSCVEQRAKYAAR